MNAGHKKAARDESRRGFLGVSNCGGDHLIAVSAQRACCGGDDEVIDGVCRDAIRLDNADESAGAVAVHCVSSVCVPVVMVLSPVVDPAVGALRRKVPVRLPLPSKYLVPNDLATLAP